MADANCIAHCVQCAAPFTRKTGRGRPATYCSDACRSLHDARRKRPHREPKPRKESKAEYHSHCKHCGKAIESQRRGKMFCSPRCACRERDGSKQSRSEYLESARQAAIATSTNYFTCAHCGVLAYRRMGGANAAKGYEHKYCAMACRSAAAERLQAEVDFLRGLANRTTAAERAKTAHIRSVVRMLARIASMKAAAAAPCGHCGAPVGRASTRPRLYCSKACAMSTPSARASRKAHKAKREARARGAGRCETINPTAVFMAAGWKCQLCNKPTPQRLRGTYHKRAPELDHVKPLSKGGTHTWDNVQCLCRECNGWKSDRVVGGQMGLFTALLQG